MSYYVHTCFVFGFGTSRNSSKLIEIRRKSIFERFRDSFWEFPKVSEMFQDVLFLQNWHTGDRPNIELRCQGERMKFQKSSKIWPKLAKIIKNLAKVIENLAKVIKNLAKISKKLAKIIENLAKIHQNTLKSNENFMFLILKRCQRHLVAIFWAPKS